MATMASAHPLVGVLWRRFTVEDYHRMGEAGILSIERHTEPRNGRYRQITIAGRGESLASTMLPTLILPVDAVVC